MPVEDSMEFDPSESFGICRVRMMAAQLDGAIDVVCDEGTKWTRTFPA